MSFKSYSSSSTRRHHIQVLVTHLSLIVHVSVHAYILTRTQNYNIFLNLRLVMTLEIIHKLKCCRLIPLIIPFIINFKIFRACMPNRKSSRWGAFGGGENEHELIRMLYLLRDMNDGLPKCPTLKSEGSKRYRGDTRQCRWACTSPAYCLTTSQNQTSAD